MYLIGIDPGNKGAIAFIELTGSEPRILRIVGMPPTIEDVCQVFKSINIDMADRRADGVLCVIEQVNGRPRQKGVFGFGKGYGVLLGCATMLHWQIVEVPPQKWKGAIGIKSQDGESLSEFKARSRFLAAKLFPQDSKLFSRAKDDGRAEALLVAISYYYKIRGVKK